MTRGQDYTARFEAPNGKPIPHAYPDPLTGGEPWTIWLGITGPGIGPDTVWTKEQGDPAYSERYANAQNDAAHVVGVDVWAGLNEARCAVLTDMAFNIGPARLRGFAKMLAAIRAGDWQEAAAQMLDSAYARQVKGRAQTNAKTLLTGELP